MATHSNILAWRIPMDRGDWRAIVHGVTKSRTRLNDKAQHSLPPHWVCFLGTLKVDARNRMTLASALVSEPFWQSKVREALLPICPPYREGGNGAPPAQITDDGFQGLRGVLGEKKGRTGWPCVIEAFEGQCGLPWWLSGKELTCQCKRYKRHGFNSWIR